MSADEKELLNEILKKLDHIENEITALAYPPEEFLQEDFVKEVEAAQERVKKGKGKVYKNIEEFFKKVEE
jgi:hypothetical protein